MPMTRFLDAHRFDAETRRVMGIAFEMAQVALRPSYQDDLAHEIVAHGIITLAKAGERDPELLCEGALKSFRARRCGGDQPLATLRGGE